MCIKTPKKIFLLVCKKKITKINKNQFVIFFYNQFHGILNVQRNNKSIYTLYKVYNIKGSNATMNFAKFFSNINPREVIKNLPDAVFVVDADGTIAWVNDKASVIFEARVEDLKGLNFNEIVANGMELAEKSYNKRNAVVTGAFTFDDKEFFVEMNAKRYIEQYFITIRDITAITNVLANAEKTGKLNKEKNIMLAKLSNEFKSPVQSIIGFSQALLDGLGGAINEKQTKYVKIINKNSSELLYFMEKFLEFSQAESSLFKSDIQPFDLVNTVQTVVKNNDTVLSAKNLIVEYDFEEFNKKVVYSDENLVKIILQNVLETSIKLTEVGSITVKITHPDLNVIDKYNVKNFKGATSESYVNIQITDTGMGLAESELEGIFEPYTQLDKVHKKTIVRSITLGTAQTILKRLGGAIWVNSEVMKGSNFNIILPVEKE